MIAYLKTLPISTRLWVLVAVFSLIVVLDNFAEVSLHGQRMREEREQQLVQLVETAHSVLRHYEQEARAGRLSQAQARAQAKQAIGLLRYGKNDYFWLHELGQKVPRMVMHPIEPELDGQALDMPHFARATASRSGSQAHYRPLDHANVFTAMNEVASSPEGNGFVTYDWPKPLATGGVTQALYPKLSFVKRFAPWDWVVGSGVYMDEIELAHQQHLLMGMIKVALWLSLFALMVWAIVRTIVRPLRALQRSIDALRRNPDHAVTLREGQPRELGQLGQSFQSLVAELQVSRRALSTSLGELRLAGSAIAEMSEGVMITDAAGTIVFVNPAFTRLSGYPADQALGQTPALLKSGRQDSAFYTAMWAQLKTEGAWAGEIWNRARDGRVFPEWLSISASRDAQGQVCHYVGVFSDITDRKRTESALRVAATAFEAQEGMFITDASGTILRVNTAFSQITGYSAEEAVGQTPRLLRSGHHDEAFYAAMQDSITRTGTWQGEIRNRRKNGEVFPEWLTITAVKDAQDQVSHYVSTLTDITGRKSAENEIERLAFYDPLTNLPNRRLLHDRLQHALASSQRNGTGGALLFIDLDNFKTLNDTRGHSKGDQLLKEAAQRLLTCVRDTDMVARLGGDEFVVLLEGLSTQGIEASTQADGVGQKILAQLHQPYDLAGQAYRYTASIGIALFLDQQGSTEELLQHADLAMYQAKADGGGTLRFFDLEMQAIVTARAALEADLTEAVRQEQFVLHYQAQMGPNGQTTGAEALVRWQHPQRGMVSPLEFIPLAEATGLILPIGQWVLQSACRQLVQWACDPGMAHLCLSVNVSAVQYRQRNFVAQVLAVLEETGANPKRLILELTESLLLENVQDIIDKMLILRGQGVRFSLDDFGTGYSSLAYLKRLPLSELKIDKSFVRDVHTDENDAAIVRTIIALAGSLSLAVIAEGVETAEQRDFLASSGCHYYQGYYFSRPLPLPNFEALARRQASA